MYKRQVHGFYWFFVVLFRHEYKLEIEFAEKEQNTYFQATTTKKAAIEKEAAAAEEEDKEYPDFPDENGDKKFSDSDSD